MFDTPVADIQSDVAVSGELGGDGAITGTLKWLADGDIAGYWGAGNFVALQFASDDEDVTIRVGLDPSQGSGLVPLDSDMNGVFKVTDPATQVFVVETVKGGEVKRQVFDLSGLVLEAEPVPVRTPIVATPNEFNVTAVSDFCDFTLTVDGVAWEDCDLVTLNGVQVTDPMELLPWSGDFPLPPETATMSFNGLTGGGYWSLMPLAAGTYTVTLGDSAGVYEPATVTITATEPPPPTPVFTVSPNPLTVAVGESVTLHGFVDGVEVDNADLSFDGEFDIADETVADHGPLSEPTVVRGKTAGTTTVTVAYLDYPAVTVPITVTAPPRLVFEPQEMTKALGDNSGRVVLMLDGEPYKSPAPVTYEPTGVFDLDALASATGRRDFSTHSVGSAIATATVSVDGETLTATFTGTVTGS